MEDTEHQDSSAGSSEWKRSLIFCWLIEVPAKSGWKIHQCPKGLACIIWFSLHFKIANIYFNPFKCMIITNFNPIIVINMTPQKWVFFVKATIKIIKPIRTRVTLSLIYINSFSAIVHYSRRPRKATKLTIVTILIKGLL